MVLAGWSWGGFLAPRAAAFDDRIAVLWADPGQWNQREVVVDRLPLSDQESTSFPDGIDPARLAPIEAYLRSAEADPMLRWRLLQRGLWVHGKQTLSEYLAGMTHYELSGCRQYHLPHTAHRRRR